MQVDEVKNPSATVLARWEDGRMVAVHDFPKFDQESRFSGFIGHAYPDPNRPGDETMLIAKSCSLERMPGE